MFAPGLFLISIFSVLLSAQDPYGRVIGRVVDSTGAVVMGASIQVTNIQTNVVSRGNGLGLPWSKTRRAGPVDRIRRGLR